MENGFRLRIKTVHLGVQRRKNLGRRITYSLMGAGFHGKISIKQSLKTLKADMWRKYVNARLIWFGGA